MRVRRREKNAASALNAPSYQCSVQNHVSIIMRLNLLTCRAYLRQRGTLNYCQICSLSREPFPGHTALSERRPHTDWPSSINYWISTVCRVRGKPLPSERRKNHLLSLPHFRKHCLAAALPIVLSFISVF